ncbi:septal ring lytic transglycosylase RlpA family protein [Oceanisphaera avium]|uniref:Endolytic peptidoglycan transglycosylase RlpA n=1 Tax=Oceanisphaera avium TaxID=1903694 RepID=A0A1Y0CWY8_9GAMM|nr:septal ring lytic transglycosylase RlpA family protein [Oceanisphaera avium]ART79822.1 septal ring lytic transglycosylase RlpA [Oceanisphaera avium]
MPMKKPYKACLALSVLLLGACSSQTPIEKAEQKKHGAPAKGEVRDARWHKETAGGRYSLRQDVPPEDAPKLDHVKNAVPRYEPYTRGGNKNYNVWGQDYEVWQEVESYRDEGMASWYGAKFHGFETSNGEVYDMYAMTAAHKNLPLPSFVRVTNKANGKQVIVRVNDRGPFHEGRVIDLSYAAAYKLGMLATGTAPVKVELIKIAPNGKEVRLAKQGGNILNGKAVSGNQLYGTNANKTANKTASQPVASTSSALPRQPVAPKGASSVAAKHIQLLATRSPDKAKALAAKLSREYGFPARVERQSEWYRLQMGPIPGNQTQATLSQLIAQGYAQAYFIN